MDISFQYIQRISAQETARNGWINCTGEDNTYTCFPNDEITELIEFCYPLQVIGITPGKNSKNCELVFYLRFNEQG